MAPTIIPARRILIIAALPILLYAASAAETGGSSDSLSVSINQRDIRTASRLIARLPSGAGIVGSFAGLSAQASRDSTFGAHLDAVGNAFETRLRREFDASTFAAYLLRAGNPELRDPDRMRIIRAMVEGAGRLKPAQQDSLGSFLQAELASEASPTLKSELLALASRFPQVIGFQDLLPHCHSENGVVRDAAYKALIRIVARHRDNGEPMRNKVVFDSLKGDAAHPPDLFRVYVLAAIGEDYVRNHLVETCASDPVKLQAILTHDPFLRHPGLIRAALTFPGNTPAGIRLRAALRKNLKDPSGVAEQLAAESPSSPLARELSELMQIEPMASW